MNSTARFPRPDIQALRGFAVLIVVLYHNKIGNVTGGYLGVDIFFVISGYLITRLVASRIIRGDFSLKEFYFRRAKRLFPAAFVTFALTAVLAPWFLNQQELRDFSIQLIGALTFTSNFVLWQQTGYFEGASDLKPLLHIWSLAIEEQYYFLLPAALLFARRSRWCSGTTVLLFLSLALCVVGGMTKPVATFYLIPTRAWELLIGSTGALWILRNNEIGNRVVANACALLFIPSLICLLFLPFFPLGGVHPGWNAFLICIATLIVILHNSPAANTAIVIKFLSKIGDISYSLYLVHWPIIALVKNSWVGSDLEIPIQFRVLTFAFSFLSAYVLYKTIEDPIRKQNGPISNSWIGRFASLSLILAVITPAVINATPASIDFKEARKTNYGLSEKCEYNALFISKRECRTSDNPDLMVWGDSFAMHLVPGLARTWTSGGVIQATKSQCGPFLGIAPKNIVKPESGMYKHQAWAEGCITFNQSVIDFLRAAPSIKIVVLSSPISQYISQENLEHVLQSDKLFVSAPANVANAFAGFHRTVSEIRRLGKSVVLIAPPPSSDFDVGGCLERKLSGSVTLGGRPGCLINRAEYRKKRAAVLSFLEEVSTEESVRVISFDPWLCNAVSCLTMIEGTMIYRDSGHLSIAGSKLLSERMQLANLITRQAK